MPNYSEIFKNLQKDYPQCNLEFTKPNDNINRHSKVKGNCNKENCNNGFEMAIIVLGRHGNIYCKECIKYIKNDKIAKTLNPGKYEKIIKNLNNKYPKILLKLKNDKDISEANFHDKVIGNCNKENCSNTFEISISRIEEQNIYCKSCKSIDNSIINYLEKFKNLKIEYPQCKLEIKIPDEKINRHSLVTGFCNEKDCSNEFEIEIKSIGKHDNIYCKQCINNIKNNKIAKNVNTGKYEKIIETLNNKYPNIMLKPENNINISEVKSTDRVNGNCNNENCFNTFEIGVRSVNEQNIYCKSCEINRKCQNSKPVLLYEKLKDTYPNSNIKVSVDNQLINEKTRITGKCINVNCNNNFSKLLQSIEKSGYEKSMKCPECTIPVMQNAELAEKNLKACFKTKIYILPSGKELSYQGYENYAIGRLINIEKIDEEDILTSRVDVPECWYKDTEGVSRRYYIDIFIPSQNRCIEVKSPYTAQIAKDIINIKLEAIKALNYKVDLWIFDNNGNFIS